MPNDLSSILLDSRNVKHCRNGRPIRTIDQVTDFVRDRRVALMMGKGEIASLPVAICGRWFKGSWMAQPEVKLIYNLLTTMPEKAIPQCRMVCGHWTALSNDIAPFADRIALDEVRQDSLLVEAPITARRLFERIRQQGRILLSPSECKPHLKPRRWLEQHMLVRTNTYHGQNGARGVELAQWRRLVPKKRSQPTLHEAVNALLVACLHSAVLAPEIRIRNWLPDFADLLPELKASGLIVSVSPNAHSSPLALASTVSKLCEQQS